MDTACRLLVVIAKRSCSPRRVWSLYVYRDCSNRIGRLSTATITFASILKPPTTDRCRANAAPGSDMLANIFRPHFCVPSQLSQCLSLMSSMCVIARCVLKREREREREAPSLAWLAARQPGRRDGGPRSPTDRRVRELFSGSFGGCACHKECCIDRFNKDR